MGRFIDNLRAEQQNKQMIKDIKKASRERAKYVKSLNFSSNREVKALVGDIQKSNYIDIWFYGDKVNAGSTILYYSNYGLENFQLDELRRLTEYVKTQIRNPHYTYRIQPLYGSGGGSTQGYYGLNQAGNAQWFGGDSSLPIIGYIIHNDNYDKSKGLFRCWDTIQRKYRLWDTKNRRYLN